MGGVWVHCLVPFFAPDLERAEELRSVWCSPCEAPCGTGVATSGPSLLKGERMGLLVLGRASWCGHKSERCCLQRGEETGGIRDLCAAAGLWSCWDHGGGL